MYGIWVTMFSIVNWILVFDIGVGNGLRNVLTIKCSENKIEEAQSVVSSAYFILGGIVCIIFSIALCTCLLINWNSFFKSENVALPAIIICLVFICINFVASLQKNEYFAIQKSEVNALFGIIVQLINLLGIVMLKYCTVNRLTSMAILTGSSTFCVNIIFSAALWKKKSYFIPSLNKVKKTYIKEIYNIGIKFFVIQLSGLILFSTDNAIVSILYGAEVVTSYSIPFAVFSVFSGVFMAFLSPFWSKFTEAKAQNNFGWIEKSIKWLSILLILFAVLIFLVVLFFDKIVYIWLGRYINYSPGLIVCFGVYSVLQIYNAIYSTVLNGIGDINVQLIVASCIAVINIPLSIFFAKYCDLGPTGVCLATVFGFVAGAIIYTIQVNHILHKNLRGKVLHESI